MTNLPLLLDRLNNPKIPKVEVGWRQIFSCLIADMKLKFLLEKTGFFDVTLHHVYFQLLISNIFFSLFPKGSIGKTFAHIIIAKGMKV